MSGFAAVLPAYNAAATVETVVRRALHVLPRVVVVDDGSTDDTGRRAARAGARVLAHPVNRGKGAALRTAFAALAGEPLEAIVTLDADGQHDPSEIPLLLAVYRATGADLVVGSREADFPSMSPLRRFGNRFSSSALVLFTGLRLPDTQSGFRLYSAPFVRQLRLRGNAYDAEMESLLQAAALRMRVESVPIRTAVADGPTGSHFRPWLDTYRICRCVVSFSIRRGWTGRPA